MVFRVGAVRGIGLLVLFLLAAVGGVSALDLAVGAKTGVEIGWLSGDWPVAPHEGDNQARVGLAVNAFGEFALWRHFSIQPELGITGRRGGADGATGVTVRVTSLDLAVLAKPHRPWGPGTVYALAGPHVVFLLGDVETETQGSDGATVSESPDNAVLYGATVGVGYALSAGPGELFADLTYTRAFNSYSDADDLFINSLGVKIGILIPVMSSGL